MTAAAFEKPIAYGPGYLPSADLSAKQFYGVYLNSTPNWVLCATNGGRCDGVLVNEPDTDIEAKVMVEGISKVVYGGTVTAGDSLMVNTAGKFVKATKGMWAVGVALQSGVASDVKAMRIRPHFVPSFRWEFFIDMTLIADGDLVTTFTPGFAGTIETFYWVQEAPVTTDAKLSSLNIEIGTTNLTGGVISLTSADCTPLGAVVASSAITAANAFDNDDTISVEASSTTTFIEGSGTIVIEGSLRAA